MAHEHKGEIYLIIHEVHYTNDKPTSYTTEGVTINGANKDEILETLLRMAVATTKPILWAGFKFPKEYKPKEKKK